MSPAYVIPISVVESGGIDGRKLDAPITVEFGSISKVGFVLFGTSGPIDFVF